MSGVRAMCCRGPRRRRSRGGAGTAMFRWRRMVPAIGRCGKARGKRSAGPVARRGRRSRSGIMRETFPGPADVDPPQTAPRHSARAARRRRRLQGRHDQLLSAASGAGARHQPDARARVPGRADRRQPGVFRRVVPVAERLPELRKQDDQLFRLGDRQRDAAPQLQLSARGRAAVHAGADGDAQQSERDAPGRGRRTRRPTGTSS